MLYVSSASDRYCGWAAWFVAVVFSTSPAMSAQATPGDVTVIVKTNDSAPDSDGFFGESFNLPAISDAGLVVFEGRLYDTSQNASNSNGIFSANINQAMRIVRGNDRVPFPDATIENPSINPALNTSGQTVFRDDLDFDSGPNLSGIFRSDGTPGGTVAVAMEGDFAPGGGQFGVLGVSISNPRPNTVNEAGQTAFAVDLFGAGVDPTNDGGVYRGDGTILTKIARLGESVPNGGTLTGLSHPQISNTGEVGFLGGLGGGGGWDLVLKGDGSSLTEVARVGQVFPDGTEITDFHPADGVPINNNGYVAFRANLENGLDNFEGVFLGNGSTLTTIAVSGQPLSDGTSLRRFDRHVAVNDSEQVAFEADITATGSIETGLFRSDGTDLVEIARTNQTLPNGLGHFSGTFYEFALNNLGQVLFKAGIDLVEDVQPTDSTALFLYDPQKGLFEIARLGDPLLGSTIKGLGISGTDASDLVHVSADSLNNLGVAAFFFELDNDIEGIAVTQAVPEPTSALLVAVTAIGVVGGRRRKRGGNDRHHPKWRVILRRVGWACRSLGV